MPKLHELNEVEFFELRASGYWINVLVPKQAGLTVQRGLCTSRRAGLTVQRLTVSNKLGTNLLIQLNTQPYT